MEEEIRKIIMSLFYSEREPQFREIYAHRAEERARRLLREYDVDEILEKASEMMEKGELKESEYFMLQNFLFSLSESG